MNKIIYGGDKMIVKCVGKCQGLYRERTWEDVEDYIFTNKGAEMANIVFESDKDIPYSHLELLFSNRDSVCISFNTVCYVMSSDGKTIDVLRYDTRKE